MKNIALNRPSKQSSISQWSTVQDSELDARVANSGVAPFDDHLHTSIELNPWWQVEFDDHYLVRKVILYNRKDYSERLSNFTLLRSNDGQNWIEFFKKTDDAPFEHLVADINDNCLARFVRVRLDGYNCLHFRQCEIFGELPESRFKTELLDLDNASLKRIHSIPDGREGYIKEIDRFHIFVDTKNYGEAICQALNSKQYEQRERLLVHQFLRPEDRVLEAGTAIGIVSMTAALIAGAENVLTYDANPAIVADARDNFQRNGLEGIDSRIGILKSADNFRKDATVDFFIDQDFWASRLNAKPTERSIVRVEKIPQVCLESEITRHNANVLICDIEGGEVDLLTEANLDAIRMIIMETHYSNAGEAATDKMVRSIIEKGFHIHLEVSGHQILLFRR